MKLIILLNLANNEKFYLFYAISIYLLILDIEKSPMTETKSEIDLPIIISNNCWGYHYYKSNEIPYPTPFIGLFLYIPDYIKLLENFESYMETELKFVKRSKWPVKLDNYPIGIINDAEIHFLHYKTEQEAREKWNRRLSRMHKNYDRYYFKFDDIEKPFDYSIIKRFHDLPFKNKISFTKIRYPEFKNNFEFYFGKPLSGGRLYQTTPFYFDINGWLSGRQLKKRLQYKIYKNTLSHFFNR